MKRHDEWETSALVHEEQTWVRQQPLRDAKREADTLADKIRECKDELEKVYMHDTDLCYEAELKGIVERKPELLMCQQEQADAIRQEAEAKNIPWKGFTPQELVNAIRQEAGITRDILQRTLSRASAVTAECDARLETARDLRHQVQDGANDARDLVRSHFERIYKLLAQRQASLVEQIRILEERKLTGVEQFVEVEQSRKEASVTLSDKCNHILSQFDVNMLNKSRLAESQLDNLAAITQDVRDLPDESGCILFKYSDRDVARMESHGGISDGWLPSLAPGNPLMRGLKKTTDFHNPTLTLPLHASNSEAKLSQSTQHNTPVSPPRGEVDFDNKMQSGLQPVHWSDELCDPVLELDGDHGEIVTHVGDESRQGSVMGADGFTTGRYLWRMKATGLGSGQWVVVGVCTALTVNTTNYRQDCLMLHCSNGEQQPLTSKEIQNGSEVEMLVDCDASTVEYFVMGRQVKFCHIPTAKSAGNGNSNNDVNRVRLFPYCTLYHPGQTVELLS